MAISWRRLNEVLPHLTEEQVLNLLNEERQLFRRVTILERLHQRYTTLRAARERMEILKEATR